MSTFGENSTFHPKELHGKTLKMVYSEDSGYGLLGGKDMETGKIYVISEYLPKKELNK